MNQPTYPPGVQFTLHWGPLISLLVIFTAIFMQMWAIGAYGEAGGFAVFTKVLVVLAVGWRGWGGLELWRIEQ